MFHFYGIQITYEKNWFNKMHFTRAGNVFWVTCQRNNKICLSYRFFADLKQPTFPNNSIPSAIQYHLQLATEMKTKGSNIQNKHLPSIVLIIRSTETLPKRDRFPAWYTVTEYWTWANMENYETICNNISKICLYQKFGWHYQSVVLPG